MSYDLLLLILFQGASLPSGLSYEMAQLRVLHGVRHYRATGEPVTRHGLNLP